MVQRPGTGVPARGHVVLASADSEAFTSLRRRSTSRRGPVPDGQGAPAAGSAQLAGGVVCAAGPARPGAADHRVASTGRLEWLIPVRVGRMTATPYGFLRGAAIVMAEDVARLPSTGITPVICGDAHLGNFGFYAFAGAGPGHRPERLRRGAPRRMGVGSSPAGRQHLGRGPAERRQRAGMRVGRAALRRRVPRRGPGSGLDRRCWPGPTSASRSTICSRARPGKVAAGRDQAGGRPGSPRDQRPGAAQVHQPNATGRRRIVEDPPLVTRISYAEADALAQGLDEYLGTLAPHWRRVLGGYTLIDIAHKVVGVGSVGLRAYVALLEGSSPDDVLFLQLKQARRSVLARYVHGESAWHAHQGQRVVEYQQALQTVSDPLLGWTSVGRTPVLRPPVPEHEGQRGPGFHRRRGAGRLRRRSSGTCWPRATPAPAVHR